jgi:diadenosine tetraphosphate (Ap4A) HIT family hydrolase
MQFTLNKNLEKKHFIIDLPLCRVLLEDNQDYPWLFLVPRRPEVSRMMDLSETDQLQLMREMDFAQHVLWNEFKPTQLNVAAIGNKTPQLHIHIIARYENDPAWPSTVWDHPVRTKCDEALLSSRIQRLNSLFSAFQSTDPLYSTI